MPRILQRGITAVLAVIALASAANALLRATNEESPLWRPPQASEAIVVGRVASVTYDTIGPSTDFHVDVSEVWKGVVPETLVIREAGGPDGKGLWMIAEDQFPMDRERSMVLFLGHFRDERRWYPMYGDYSYAPWIIERDSVYGDMSPGIPVSLFKRLVEDAAWSATAHWVFNPYSVQSGCGRMVGRIALRDAAPDCHGLVHVPKLRLVVRARRDGHFELPWIPAGRYEASVYPYYGKLRTVGFQIKPGQVDTVAIPVDVRTSGK